MHQWLMRESHLTLDHVVVDQGAWRLAGVISETLEWDQLERLYGKVNYRIKNINYYSCYFLFHMNSEWLEYTVQKQSSYPIIFTTDTLSGEIRCLLWVQSLTCILLQSLHCCMQYHAILEWTMLECNMTYKLCGFSADICSKLKTH